MGMFDTLLGRKPGPAAKPRHSRPAPSTQFDSQQTQTGTSSVRKDLLKLALRETLTRNGIPPTWISADLLRSTNTKRESGLHVRFLLRHWDPRLLLHAVALENHFTDRLLMLDPMARSWVMGFSWQFAMNDQADCPALPHPATWTAPPPPSMPAALGPNGEPSSYGDVIAGPTALDQPKALDDVRADLERLLALRDEDKRKHSATSYAPTRPATL
jgi:hypothetical protein